MADYDGDPAPHETTKAEVLWCLLCNTRHPFGTPCDQEKIDQLRRQSDLVKRLVANQKRRVANGGL